MEAADDAPEVPQPCRAARPNPETRRPESGYDPTTLRTLLTVAGHLPARAALDILRKLVCAVQRLHAQGLAHDDLKPENILVIEGEPKVAEVGLVGAISEPPPRAGTPSYMAPQGRADDLYALGRILYELVTGQPASAFPRVPADLPQRATAGLTPALQIVHRACRTDPTQRFGTIEALAEAVATALRPPRGLRSRGRRRSPRQRTGLACISVAAVAFGALGVAVLHRRLIPHLVWHTHRIALDRQAFRLVEDKSQSPIGRQHPFLNVVGSPLECAGRYVCALPHPARNFVLDARLMSTRPWGSLALGLSDGSDTQPSVDVSLHGQPDGLGLLTCLNVPDLPGAAERRVRGHPLPGVEYVLRLARIGDSVQLALWPRATDTTQPLLCVARLPSPAFEARRVLVEAHSFDALRELKLVELSVAEYTAPFDSIAAARPAGVGPAVQPAYLPPSPADAPMPVGNLLAAPWHPYDSGAWMSIGHWAWWSDVAPSIAPKVIRCTPGSRDTRKAEKDCASMQFLRFDQGRLRDFDARLRVRLADAIDAGTAPDEPFLYDSERGLVGLAIRLQDSPPPGCAWGGGYLAQAELGKDRAQAVQAVLTSFEGLRLRRDDKTGLEFVGSRCLKLERLSADLRSRMLTPGGFTLRLRALGDQFGLWIDDDQVIAAADSGWFTEGRIALAVAKAIVAFDSLEVTAAWNGDP